MLVPVIVLAGDITTAILAAPKPGKALSSGANSYLYLATETLIRPKF